MGVWLAFIGLMAAGVDKTSVVRAPVFSCSLGQKQVSVRAIGNDLVYTFGTKTKTELTIVGSVSRRNVFFRSARFANIENQLRFTKGRFSYIVFSVGGNLSAGARALSGLTVLDGTKPISELECRHWTELDTSGFESSHLATDGEAYSAF